MKKLSIDVIKQLIKEEIGAGVNLGSSQRYMPTANAGSGYVQNYPAGKSPDNTMSKEPYAGKPPHETGPVETHIEDGEMYVTQGKNQYKLVFDNEELTSGHVVPVGEYKFTIDPGGPNPVINWFDNAPANVRFDAGLEKQILDYSGRERE